MSNTVTFDEEHFKNYRLRTGCKYCTEYEDLPEHIINDKPVGKVFDTNISEDGNGWHIELPSGNDK